MGMLKDLFGGNESKQKSASYRQSQGLALDDLLNLYGPRAGANQVYSGERVAPLSGATQTALQGVQNYANQFASMPPLPTYQQAGQALGGLLTGQTGAEPFNPKSIDNYYRQAIEQPAMQQWSDYIKPEIQEQYAGPGYWSSARANAVTEGSEDMQQWLGAQRAQLEWDTLQSNRNIEEAKANRALSAVGQATAYPSAGLQAIGQVANLAGISQQQAQAEINASIQKFAEENRLTDPEDMQILLSLLGMNFSTGYSRSDSNTGAITGLTESFANLGKGAAAFGSIGA